MTSRGVVLLALVLLGCHHVRPPGETGFHDSSSRDSRRGDTGLVGEGDDYYPLGTGWSWSYDTADGGAEHRVTMGATTFEGVDCWGVSEWNSNATGGISDSSTVYYMDDVSGVSLLGTEHADSSDPTATDVLVYDPPMLFVPADPAASPSSAPSGACISQ